MAKMLSEDIKIKQKGDVFLVTRVIEEELSAKEVTQNFDNLKQAIDKINQDLKGMPDEIKRIKAKLEEDLEFHKNRLKGLEPALDKAKALIPIPAGIG